MFSWFKCKNRAAALMAAASVLLVAESAVAQSTQFCKRNAQSREVLLEHAAKVTPEMAARGYLELYGVQYFEREAKAVWDRMVKDGQDMESALDAHVARYHGKKSAAEQDAIREAVRTNMRIGLETHDLIAAFEAVTVTADDYRARMAGVLGRWKEPEQPWMGQFDDIAAKYRDGGVPEAEAALRAYLETFNALDRKRTPSQPHLKPGTPCYEEGLYIREFSTRMELLDAASPGAKTRLERLTASSYQKAYRDYRPEAWMQSLGLMK